VVGGAVVLALAVTCGLTSYRWVGTTFPGFFVMPNRVVPSVGLLHWTGVRAGGFFQHAVLTVDGAPVSSAEEIYARVRARPPGTPVEYTFAAGRQRLVRAVPSMVFGARDYLELFVPFLLNGLLFSAAGVVVWLLKPRTAASRAMLAFGLCLGVFGVTGADLYAPQRFYRLYLAAEAFLPATLLHLALVFPEDHLRGRRRAVLLLPYGTAFGLALAHEVFHFDPAVFSSIRNLCTAFLGVAGLGLIVAVLYAYRVTTSHLVRQRVRVLAIGTTLGFGPAALLMAGSGLTGGNVAVNPAAFTAFVFPLTLAYAIVKHDLFAIEAMVKRAVYYAALTGALFVSYALVLVVFNVTLNSFAPSNSRFYPVVVALAVIMMLDPLKGRLQAFVDRVCFRTRYDAKTVLQTTGQALASTIHLPEVLDVMLGAICREMLVSHAHVYLRERTGVLAHTRSAGAEAHAVPEAIPADHQIVETLAIGARAVSVYDTSEDAASAPLGGDLLAVMQADLLLPLRFGGELVGLVALGSKQSGGYFTAAYLDFLATLLAHSVVSIRHAIAYRQIDDLNHALESKVAQRTEELARANDELTESLHQQEHAYGELQRSQERLLHAEKMATLGQLTAGIAHEISTPLGASLSSLSVLEDLARECREALDAPDMAADDRRAITDEIGEVAAEARAWTEKAARFVRSIKGYTLGRREELQEREFNVGDVIDETRQLLAHRLRLCRCTLRVDVADGTPALFGDAGKLGQVLTNLVTNAIDAYRDAGAEGGEIAVLATLDGTDVVLRVRDRGAGIRPEHLSRIFEELFTTKPPGLGTGLGLSICRTIVSECFGGTIDVDSEVGCGSTFSVWLPIRRAVPADARRSDARAPLARAGTAGSPAG
jgi:signal transduction histidine kinase